MKKITIKKVDAGLRLDVFLSEKLKMSSRSQCQKLTKNGLILINNKIAKANHILKEEDEVSFLEEKKEVKINKKSNEAELVKKIKIIKTTKDYIILNKPAGLIVHLGNEYDDRFSLVDFLIAKYPEIKKIGDDPSRPGIVHRLDKDVSGLMIVARNQDFFDYIKNNFKKRQVEKKYLALVYGQIDRDNDVIDFPIERGRNGKMAAHSHKQGGKRAITEFNVLQRFINFTLLEVNIKTGRTHQIRVHLSAYDHSVVGDNLYTKSYFKEKNKKFDIKRIFLVSYSLAFIDLNGEKQEFKIELPNDLQEFIKNKVK